MGRVAAAAVRGAATGRVSRPACLALVAACFLPAGGATAGDGAGDLARFLQEVRTLEADFRQVLVESDSDRERASEGRLSLQRPDRFRWEYREPAPQLVVADGQDLWLFDPDLEQVTVRSLDDGLSATPAVLLSGEGRLDDAFEQVAVYTADGVDWVELRPRAADSDFQGVQVGFSGGVLAAMELVDSLGQTTRIRFTDVRTNVPLDPVLFVFEPPPGTDVLRDSDF